MDSTRTPVAIESLRRRGVVTAIGDVHARPGALFSWLRDSVLRSAGIEPDRWQTFSAPDGRVFEREVASAIIHVQGQATVTVVVFAEVADETYLGSHALAGLNLELADGKLVDGGPLTVPANYRVA